MPRSIWNGAIAFGAVYVPISLHTATESKTIHFREVHLEDGGKIEHRRFCSKEDREVPYKEVVKGYEVAKGEFVVLEKDEIAAAAGPGGKVVELEEFVPGGDIDPVFFEKTYYLGARGDGAEAYRLLHDALERTGRVGIGRFTFHNREYLAAVRPLPQTGVLALHTMRFADELVAGDELELDRLSKAPGDKEVEMAGRLVESLHTDFRPEAHEDTYREAVLAVIGRKAKGETIELEAPPEDDGADDDLLAALEASLKG